MSKLFIALGLTILTLWCVSAAAHHVLGRPADSLNEDSNTPPSIQQDVQIGEFVVTYMAYPAFPKPNQRGRINIYASNINNNEPFVGNVIFKARNDSWFTKHEDVLGVQEIDDSVYRQGFLFESEGNYIISAEFEHNGEPYKIDFPLQIGEPAVIGPVGYMAGLVLIILVIANLIYRRRSERIKIRTATQLRRKEKLQ